MSKDSPFATCLICASADTLTVGSNLSFGVNLFQCKACGFVQSEFISSRSQEIYYTNFYRARLGEFGLSTLRMKGAAQARGQMAYLLEQRPELKVATALDYGTAEGSLGHELRAVAEQVFVTEADPQFVELLKADPLLTFVGESELASERFRGFFDLICISHVLEHLTDPYQIMDLFGAMLKPGGLLLVDIPNEVRMLAHGFQANGHVSYFSKETFAKFVEVQGSFDLLELRTCNREVDFFIASRFKAPEEYAVPLAKDGTTIRALLRNREPAARRCSRSHTFDEAALLNEYSARIQLFHRLLQNTRARVAELEREVNRLQAQSVPAVSGSAAA